MDETNENQLAEKHKRSLFKSVTYRILIMSIEYSLAYVFTQDAKLSIKIVIFVSLYRTIIYYLHERIWSNIRWGK